jgi:large subunit ribosomal protein L15
MGLHDLKPAEGSRKTRKTLGRGMGSGLGKTSGKGHKGQKARAGGGVRTGFEGGQMPLYRRVPKRGFNNSEFRKIYDVINLASLADVAAGTVVDHQWVVANLSTKSRPGSLGLKVLGSGEVSAAFTVRALRFSESAKAKIEAAGGTAEVV